MNPVQKIGTIQKMVKDSRRYCETETYVLEIVNNYQPPPKKKMILAIDQKPTHHWTRKSQKKPAKKTMQKNQRRTPMSETSYISKGFELLYHLK
ncbi:MAG TPA: hypothetical protein VK503_00900 [Candidatus Bathyarchaeia archaeon]|nr:hypothetical protein [Candidatus Bathyarchaeia archaeon]